MRIIGGKFRGLRLSPVGKGDQAASLRPTSDRVRESIFNLLQNGGYADCIQDKRALDLFAGTGALGLEALSRGAAEVLFVDQGKIARGLIQKNIDLCRCADQVAILNRDATKLGQNGAEPFELIFLDPPYGRNLGETALLNATKDGWVAKGALIVWEEGEEKLPPVGFDRLDCRKYGESRVHLLEYLS